jgi:hypothetical protein
MDQSRIMVLTQGCSAHMIHMCISICLGTPQLGCVWQLRALWQPTVPYACVCCGARKSELCHP